MAICSTGRSEVFHRAKTLKKTAAFVPIREIAFHWLQTFGCLALYYFYPSWWLYVPVVLFISARQYGLAILLHDAQHTLLHPNKAINHQLGKWLLAAPLGTVFTESQKNHLDHHYHFGSRERDPDYALYCFGDPSRKQSISQLLRLLGARLVGEKAIHMLKNIDASGGNDRAEDTLADRAELQGLPSRLRSLIRRLWSVIFVQTLFLATFTYIFGWYGYFALWALPLATLAALYNDFRIFCEHSLIGRDSNNADERMVTFISNPAERFFIAPNHMNYHAEHHLFPYVPHGNLPALREAIRNCPEWNDRIEWRAGYFGHLRAYINAFKRTSERPTLSGGSGNVDSLTAN